MTLKAEMEKVQETLDDCHLLLMKLVGQPCPSCKTLMAILEGQALQIKELYERQSRGMEAKFPAMEALKAALSQVPEVPLEDNPDYEAEDSDATVAP